MPRIASTQLSILIAADGKELRFASNNDLHHLTVVFSVLLLISLQQGGVPLDLFQWPFLASILILCLGVPHGAFDIAVLRRRWSAPGQFILVKLLLSYVGLAIFVVASWTIAPGLCLAVFLLISAYHFSGDWPMFHKTNVRCIAGLALLSATTLFHEAQVGDIFALLASRDSAIFLAQALNLLSLLLLALAGASLVVSGRSVLCEMAEYASVVAAAVWLPPMTFFVLYFCLVHSIRHTVEVRRELFDVPIRELILRSAPYALVAIVGTLAAGLLIARYGIGLDLLSAVFIALAALTVPHMVLVEQTRRS